MPSTAAAVVQPAPHAEDPSAGPVHNEDPFADLPHARAQPLSRGENVSTDSGVFVYTVRLILVSRRQMLQYFLDLVPRSLIRRSQFLLCISSLVRILSRVLHPFSLTCLNLS
jgi:hypothetical protein